MEKLGQAVAVVVIFIILINGTFSLLGEAQLRASMDEESYEVYRTAMDVSGVWSFVLALVAVACILGLVVVVLAILGVFK
jgi:hypothetical protein